MHEILRLFQVLFVVAAVVKFFVVTIRLIIPTARWWLGVPDRWRRRRRLRAGACLECGYLLLAYQDRCPECGNVAGMHGR